MKIEIFYIFAAALWFRCQGMPTGKQGVRIEARPELPADYFVDNIILDASNYGRNGVLDKSRRWPNNTVYYRFADDIDAEHRAHIIKGMSMIEKVSCIIFEEASPDQNSYVNVTSIPDGGCASDIGFGNTIQMINLEPNKTDIGCFRMAAIVHEFLHTLGFEHQHMVPNRNEYVRIIYENIEEDKKYNFEQLDSVLDFDIEYDYASIMHYPLNAFSINGKNTIEVLKEDAPKDIGRRQEMSPSDIKKLNLMYGCDIKS